MFKLQKSEDKEFALQLMRENMLGYYESLGIEWKPELFERSWSEFENLEIIFDGEKIGVLRLSSDSEALYIRDLQIKSNFQNRGVGSEVTKAVFMFAKDRSFNFVRLRCFKINPAQELYARLGFEVSKSDKQVVIMEVEVA